MTFFVFSSERKLGAGQLEPFRIVGSEIDQIIIEDLQRVRRVGPRSAILEARLPLAGVLRKVGLNPLGTLLPRSLYIRFPRRILSRA
jgi:hypothetical protein